MKRGIDLVGSVLLLVALSGVLILLALVIKLNSRGPVIFRQVRTGRGGKAFMIYKFRTLGVSADVLMDADGKEQQVAPGDARVTRMGHWLRRSGLDELPQLVNVLRGEMSLVGPRPHVPSHDAYYAARIPGYLARYGVRPGITGWAQIHGLTQDTPTLAHMARRVRYDREYIAMAGGWRDIQILGQTPLAVVWPRLLAPQLRGSAVKKQAVIS